MRVLVLALRLVGTIVDGFREPGCPFDAALAGDEGKNGIFSGSDLDAGRLIEQGDSAVGDVVGVGTDTAVEDGDECQSGEGKAKRETGWAMIESAQVERGWHGKQSSAYEAFSCGHCLSHNEQCHLITVIVE